MDAYWFDQLLVPFCVRLFFVVGIVGVLLGAGLLVATARVQAMMGALNRWVSVRQSTKSLSVPRDISQAVYRHRVWVGLAFALGGAILIYALLERLGGAQLVAALEHAYPNPAVPWLFDSIKWILIIGCVLAVVVGLLLLFFPAALQALEAGSNRWVSSRRWALGGDTMHLGLDSWVERSPRLAGAIMLLGSAFVAINAGILIFTRL